MSVVIDASMTLAWLLDDERATNVEAILLRVANLGAMVPSLWRLEVANGLRSAVRRRRCDEDHVDASLRRLARLPIAVDDETDIHAWGATRALSREEDLTLYDAAYLELSLRRGLPLASNDAALNSAAVRRRVDLAVG